MTDQTLRELSVRTNLDWFSTLTYLRPHPPLVAPAPYNSIYVPKELPLPPQPNSVEQMKAGHPFYKAYFDVPSNHGLYTGFDGCMDEMSGVTTAQLRAVYLGLVTEVDFHIGRILDYLRDTGQYDDTLIVVTADHGEMLGDHHMWGKSAPLNSAFHIPLIIRDPQNRQTAASEVNEFTESIDIAPTLLDWTNLPQPLAYNGHSLIPLIKGEKPDNWRTHMFAEMDLGDPVDHAQYHREFGTTPHQSSFAILQDNEFKLVYFNGNTKPLLFDMRSDPQEASNLASDPAHATQLLNMVQKMLDHRMTHAHHALSRISLTPQGLVVN